MGVSLLHKNAIIAKKKINVSRTKIPVMHKNLFFFFNGICYVQMYIWR
jgi:hypothetical protein